MRSTEEMYELILGYARVDHRIRAVLLNGSRANKLVQSDKYQDFDIVYVVDDIESFKAGSSWLNHFGKRLMLQIPESMRHPSNDGHVSYLMLFEDGNRIDLSLIPQTNLELIADDSLTIKLLDKDGLLPEYPLSNDSSYYEKKPTKLEYDSCCNNFWWCLQNVGKGIVRNEIPYAMMMYHTIVREEFHDMIAWSIAMDYDFKVSAGKMGKFFKNYLPEKLYSQYLRTYSSTEIEAFWNALFEMCVLFSQIAKKVGNGLGYDYELNDELNMMGYLRQLKTESIDERRRNTDG